MGVRGCSGWGGQGGCERRIEVFVKIEKKNLRGGGGGRGGGEVGEGRGVGSGRGRWVRVDVNAMLGVGGDVGYGDVNQE